MWGFGRLATDRRSADLIFRFPITTAQWLQLRLTRVLFRVYSQCYECFICNTGGVQCIWLMRLFHRWLEEHFGRYLQLLLPIVTAKRPYRLSCGEKKRVAIATVLAMDPAILVMDEPTAGLDPFSRREIMRLLKAFHHTRIITSHDLDMVAEVCNRVIVLHDGPVKADGTPVEIFNNINLLTACRLEPPLSSQSCAVCSAARSI